MKPYEGKTDKVIEHIAEHCHEINRLYCLSHGDDSQPVWADAPEWQRESACNGVIFHLTNHNVSPADSHNSWMAEKVKSGWVYGKVKDEKAKTHPQILPYERLPLEQQIKDSLFSKTVEMYKDYYKTFVD